jgi:hypothetical protein
MNTQKSIMVHCIMHHRERVTTDLLDALISKVNHERLSVLVSLVSHGEYWKYEGTEEAVYKIKNREELLNVAEFIARFNIHWHYVKDIVTDVATNQQIEEESAIWSKNVSPDEVFLLPEITWVHVYTWD